MPGESEPRGRIFLDFSTSLRWSGPPSGIVRVEREFARWGRRHIPELTLVFFDWADRCYREVHPDYAEFFIGGDATLDALGLVDPMRARKSKTARLPPSLKPVALWVLQFRHKLLQALERVRLTTRDPGRAALMDRIQRRVMSPKYRSLMTKGDGTRRPFVPADLVCGEPVAFRPDDILVCTGAGWVFTDIGALRRRQQRDGFGLALFCHDVIPLLFPHFYKPADVQVFRDYIEAALPVADLVVFNLRKVEMDTCGYCAEHAIQLNKTAVIALGADFPRRQGELTALPDGLQPGRYAMFVSTIEPRKGHHLLYEVWRRLVEEGVVAASGFKLVFVGRTGWMVDDLIADLAGDRRIADSLLRLEKVDDHTMATLYRCAAFCCYPSIYEGYGLPIVEAFHFGKAVLTSTGGALPEVAGDFSPCIAPTDEEAWYRTMKQWIEDPAVRAPFEEKIRTAFNPPTWNDAAASFFSHIETQRRRIR